jgi:hypothetical protein
VETSPQEGPVIGEQMNFTEMAMSQLIKKTNAQRKVDKGAIDTQKVKKEPPERKGVGVGIGGRKN